MSIRETIFVLFFSYDTKFRNFYFHHWTARYELLNVKLPSKVRVPYRTVPYYVRMNCLKIKIYTITFTYATYRTWIPMKRFHFLLFVSSSFKFPFVIIDIRTYVRTYVRYRQTQTTLFLPVLKFSRTTVVRYFYLYRYRTGLLGTKYDLRTNLCTVRTRICKLESKWMTFPFCFFTWRYLVPVRYGTLVPVA